LPESGSVAEQHPDNERGYGALTSLNAPRTGAGRCAHPRPGEIVPLSTLTHELDGGTRWPHVGDWAAVTDDLLKIVRDHDCYALSLGLPAVARALVCAGPHSEVRAVVPATGEQRAYGPADRIEGLIEVGRQLARAEAGSPLWPGDGLLALINSADASCCSSAEPTKSARSSAGCRPGPILEVL